MTSIEFDYLTSEIYRSLAIGLIASILLRMFYLAVSSEWPRHYSAAKTVLESHSRSNMLRYVALRVAPVYIFAILCAIVATRIHGRPELAVFSLTALHLNSTSIRALYKLYKYERSSATAAVLGYHAVSIIGIVAIAIFALFSFASFERFVPSSTDATNALWTAALAALMAAGLKRAMHFENADGSEFLERLRDDIGAQSWAFCDAAAETHRTDADFLRAILLAEVQQRPRWVRKVENSFGKFYGPGTYGVAQMHAGGPIDDFHSITLLAESYAGFRPRASQNGDMQRLRTASALERHNSSSVFVDNCLAFYEELLPTAQWSTDATGWDGRPTIEVLEITIDGDDFVLAATASVDSCSIFYQVDDSDPEEIAISPRAPERARFVVNVPLEVRELTLAVVRGDLEQDGENTLRVDFVN